MVKDSLALAQKEGREGTKHNCCARHLACAQAAMASCRDHCAESSGEEQTFWSLTASVHNFSSSPYL